MYDPVFGVLTFDLTAQISDHCLLNRFIWNFKANVVKKVVWF